MVECIYVCFSYKRAAMPWQKTVSHIQFKLIGDVMASLSLSLLFSLIVYAANLFSFSLVRSKHIDCARLVKFQIISFEHVLLNTPPDMKINNRGFSNSYYQTCLVGYQDLWWSLPVPKFQVGRLPTSQN
ncbi:uncharacterized protein LOC110806525 isoform X2 [Carica papaya]|uniref:uncharacterized protein LOC110806525 isoform X2 n=1 Tax=Carica papaya TaxID=3649 RepID=UPI000B8CF02A|nr:uncharacterized protein LOC110806525 isoform X2 [Carica papaya]